MVKIKVNLLFGLSIILDYLTVFSNNKHINFEIQFNNKLIKELRPNYDEIYFNLLKKYLLENISDMSNVELFETGEEYPTLLPNDIVSILGVELKSMKLYDVTKKNKLEINHNKYIIINTKVITGKDIGIKYMWDNLIKNRLISILNEYNYNIILIGEREYNECYEYSLHNTFSIYSDIINGGLKNIIDLTTTDTISLYEEKTIIRNLNYLSNSIFNIHIGEGGGIKIFGHTNNLIALTTSPILLLEYVNTDKFVEYSFDPNEFLNKVKKILDQYV